jgi:ssDNA-binding Zn-finger/Zn-ribbon topoisomerase 1
MKWWKPLEPVATEAERRRRRLIYWSAGVQVMLAITMVYFGALRSNMPVVVICLVLLFMGNIALALAATSVAGGTWAARQALRKSGYRVCPGCRYDLSASPAEGVCPECGATYTPESLRAMWEEAYRKMLEKPGR